MAFTKSPARLTNAGLKVGDRYILADKLAEDTLGRARLDATMYRRLREVTADELSGLSLKHPLANAREANGEWDDVRDFRPPTL